MACSHHYIFVPHKVCDICGEIDEECLYPISDFYTGSNPYQKERIKQEPNLPIPPYWETMGKTESLQLGTKTIVIIKDYRASKMKFASNTIKKICKNLDAGHLVPVAMEYCEKWFNAKEGQGKTLIPLFAAIWYSMRYNSYPMTYKRYMQLLRDYGYMNRNISTNLINFLDKVMKELHMTMPRNLLHITDSLLSTIQTDEYYAERVSKYTDKKQYFQILRNRSLKLAHKLQEKPVGSEKTFALILILFVALRIENHLIKSEKIKKPLNSQHILSASNLNNLFAVTGLYLLNRVFKLEPLLLNNYKECMVNV